MAKTRDKGKTKELGKKVVARNKRARFDYEIEMTIEAGISLQGTEVKSLRAGQASLEQAHARVDRGEAWLVGATIPEYAQASWTNHAPTRRRKLLLHRREIDKLGAMLQMEGRTLIPLELYFDAKGRAKVELAVGRGRKHQDRREHLAKKDAQREMARALRRE